MKIFNPDGTTRLLGKSIPNIFVWILLAIAVLLVIKIGNIFSSIFNKIKSFLGFDDTQQRDDIQKTIINEIKKDPAVQPQMIVANATKAQRLEEAMQGFGFDDDAIYEIFATISGPNMMKAIYTYFGTRTIRKAYFFTHTGDLGSCLRDRLWSYQLNRKLKDGFTINQKLAWI